jgi:aspartate/methionine/tyrosine aminotransferase
VTCASSVSQRAALAAFTDRGLEAARAYLEIFRRRRDLMARELGRIDGVTFSPPDGAFYFFVDVRRFGPSLELAKRILDRRKVVTIPGEAFGDGGRGYLRISFAASEENIVRGIAAIADELAM